MIGKGKGGQPERNRRHQAHLGDHPLTPQRAEDDIVVGRSLRTGR